MGFGQVLVFSDGYWRSRILLERFPESPWVRVELYRFLSNGDTNRLERDLKPKLRDRIWRSIFHKEGFRRAGIRLPVGS